jgi:hypothetical protein
VPKVDDGSQIVGCRLAQEALTPTSRPYPHAGRWRVLPVFVAAPNGESWSVTVAATYLGIEASAAWLSPIDPLCLLQRARFVPRPS